MEHQQWHNDMPEMIIVYAAVNGLGVLVGILIGLAL
jgi:hypothetical protein